MLIFANAVCFSVVEYTGTMQKIKIMKPVHVFQQFFFIGYICLTSREKEKNGKMNILFLFEFIDFWGWLSCNAKDKKIVA